MPPTNYKWNSSSYLKNNLSTGLILLIFIQLWYLIPKSGFVSSNWILDNIKDFFFHFYSLNGWSISSVTKSEFGDDSNDSKDSQHLAERIGRGAGQKVLSFLGFFFADFMAARNERNSPQPWRDLHSSFISSFTKDSCTFSTAPPTPFSKKIRLAICEKWKRRPFPSKGRFILHRFWTG